MPPKSRLVASREDLPRNGDLAAMADVGFDGGGADKMLSFLSPLRDLDRGAHTREGSGRGLLHGHANDLLLSRLDKDLLCEILVAVLPHSNCVFTG
jgi:hypothetical protein